MGMLSILAAALATLLLGIGIGCIPVVKDWLHWNLWFIIPVSGAVLGAVFGAIQFGIAFLLNQKTTAMVVLVLAVVGAASYAATDVGFYVSTVVPVQGVEGIPDGDYALSDLMSFWDFMRLNLGASTLKSGRNLANEGGGMEIGATGTTISYFVDLLGAFLATLVTILVLEEDRPYCDPCRVYKKKMGADTVEFAANNTLVKEIFGGIKKCIRDEDGPGLLDYVRELKAKYGGQSGSVKIVVDRRQCSRCSEWTAVGKVYRMKGKEWDRANDLDFRMSWHEAAAENAPA